MKKQWFILVALLVFVLAACTQAPKDDEVPRDDMNEEPGMNEDEGIDERRDIEGDNNKPNENMDEKNQIDEEENGNENDRPTSSEPIGDLVDGDTNFTVSPEDAYDIYLEKFPNTKVREVKLDRERNAYVYQIKGFDAENEYEVKIDPDSGDVLADKTKNKPNNHQEIPKEILKNVPNFVSEALVDAGEGAILDEWEVDYDNGIIELDIEIDLANGRDVDYKYNLETGELIKKS